MREYLVLFESAEIKWVLNVFFKLAKALLPILLKAAFSIVVYALAISSLSTYVWRNSQFALKYLWQGGYYYLTV